MAWFPAINTLLLVVLGIAMAWRLVRGQKELRGIELVYVQNGELLGLLKVLIVELRLRPCILPPGGVTYPTDLRSMVEHRKEGT